MTVFGNSSAGGGKQVFPIDYQAVVSQRLVDASHVNDIKLACECLADPFVDVNFIGTVSLKSKKTELLLRDESPHEVRVEYEEFKIDVTAMFLAAHAGNLSLVGKLLVSASIFGKVPGLGGIVDTIDDIVHHRQKIKGTVVLTKKHVLDFTSIGSSLFDGVLDLIGQKVSLQLVSEDYSDPKDKKLGGKIGKPAYLKTWNTTLTPITVSDTTYEVNFDLDEDLGIPGAFIIKNNHENEFFLKTVTLENVPGYGTVQFVCNSWVYPARYYKQDRIFFSNKTYLPDQTPEPLKKYREQELNIKRGDGTSEMKEWDRVYDYAYYNDLGDCDRGDEYARPVLGGAEHPYPRRGRTGRPPLESDPKTESRLPLMSLDIYVPRDEKFGHEKMSDFIGYGLKAVPQFILPELKALLGSSGHSSHFESFEETLRLYEGGIKLPGVSLASGMMKTMNLEMLSQILPTDGQGLLRFPMPQVIKEDRHAWMTDEEFGRQTLAGVNPVTIRRLEEFPPKSKLDRKQYGDQDSKITEDHIKNNLDGLTVAQAINSNKLYMLDYHDALLPYVKRINSTPSAKIYATRTLLFLNDDGALKPVAIELSLPHPERDELGAISTVYTPAEEGAEGAIWKLAKAYAAVNDSGYHQLVSHWLNTHAVMEPFVIATNRQLSDVHPIYKLLQPHFRDTMTINALARQTLINAGGILESTVFPNKYALEMSSAVYKNWVFTDQALPRDLKKRGMAVEDPNSPHGLRLLIEDYPFAVDGLEVWSATRDWVKDYCSFYYKNDEMVRKDPELQSWWKDVREKGHGDLKDATWWPKMDTLENLIESCTTIVWIGSALHAAVNFGQYPYAGYLPNRPTLSCRFMPEKGTPEYEELDADPEKAFLKTVTPRLQTLLGISLIEILSKHASDELYLGQRDNPHWTADSGPLEALQKFMDKIEQIEIKILKMNSEDKYKNRFGPVKMPYTLLVPTSEEGLTGKGVPNSISI